MTDEQDLIKEVNEEVRQDNYKNIWNKYKKYIFILITLILVSVTSINIFKYNKEKKIEKQSELFYKAIKFIELNDYQNAQNILKDINHLQSNGFSDLSFLYILDLVNKKKISFDLENLKVSKNSLFYGLIKLQKFNYEINSNKENINNIDEIIEFTKPTSTWKYLAHELLASYYIKKKDFDNALQSLDAIINSNESSEFVKERAKTIFEMLKQKK